jgi:hypothetical protein
MATVTYRGLWDDVLAGNVVAAPDLRVILVMSNTTIDTEADAQDLTDFTTLDECDGVGYAQLDLANVAVAYDATNDRLDFDADDGDMDGGGGSIAVSSRQVTRVLIVRYVDGTNDIPWFSRDIGPYTLAGGPFDFVWHADGIAYAEAV